MAKSLLDLGNSVKSLFGGVKSFVQQNPTPASFVGKKIQPLQQFLQQGTQRVQQSFQNPSQYNFYQQAAQGNVPTFQPFKPVGQFVGNYVQNRYIQPVLDIPKNTKALFAKDTPLFERGMAGLGLLGGAATFTPDPVQDAIMPIADFMKGFNASAIRGGNLKDKLSSATKAMSLENPVGLGTAVTTDKIGEMAGNLAELPIAIGMTGKLNKKEVLGFDKKTIELARQGFTPEVKNLIKDFAVQVETSSSPNKKNFGELGDYIHSLAATLWGEEKTANLTNTQLKNALDVVLKQVDDRAPMGRFYPVGMTARSIRDGETHSTIKNQKNIEATISPKTAFQGESGISTPPKIIGRSANVESGLRESMSTATSPEDAINKLNQFVGEYAKKADKRQMADLRASLNKEITTLIGGTGDYKKDYAIRVALRNDTEMGSLIRQLESHIEAIDRGEKIKPVKPAKPPMQSYNAEADVNTAKKLQSQQKKLADRDFREWSQMIFKQEGAISKNKEKVLVDAIGRNIESATENATAKRILSEKTKAAQELAQGRSEAIKSYVTNDKGKVVTSKGGSPIDRDVMLRAEDWKDKPRLSYARETIDRNFEDIMGADAPEMKARYIEPVKKAEADRIRWLNKERQQIQSLGIAPRSEESKLVQQLGEGLIDRQKVSLLPNGEKIINAEQVLRAKYKTYLTDINRVLTRNGYDPIPERKDYFRHFTEVQGILEQFGIPVRDSTLPTDINGLSADFKPGKNFFTSALQRKGDITDYDAIQGIDKYIDGASKQIFHTDNIQNLRLFEKAIRETFAGTKHLTNFAADLGEYTNALSGKKAMIDRSIESALGRGVYAGADALRRKTGANMVGANVASAMTNYIPLTQSLATTDKNAFAKGMIQTIGSLFKDDGFAKRSDFLTRRLGSDPLSMTSWDKVADKSMWLFKTIDKFVSGTIVRSKYTEAIQKGMSPNAAMKYADDWAARIMADRSVGSMPTLFNSKTLGLLTQFQLEVNNQVSFLFKDIPRSYNTVGAASALGQAFIYGYIFNNMFEKGFGRRPAFDPIGVALQAYEDYTNPDMKEGQATKNLVNNVRDQIPFGSLTGGRIPLSGAVPDVMAIAQGESTWGKELKKPLFNVLPPFGGGQIKKTIEGIGAYKRGASVSDSGRVRYPIPQTPVNAARTAIGGQYTTPEARDYFRQGKTPLGEKQSSVLLSSQNKVGTYNTFMDKRKESAANDKAKEELKSSNQSILEKNNKIYILQDNGDVRTIDPSFQPKKPTLTGKTELDKKLISKYNSEITQKANNIYDMYKAGKLTQDDAERQLSDLKSKKLTGGSKKAKKITIKKTPVKKFKISMPKTSKMPSLKIAKAPSIKTSKRKAIKIKTKNITYKKLKPLTVKRNLV